MAQSKYNNPVSATLNGILDSFQKGEPIGALKESDQIDGKKCLITGSNSGLGFAIAKELANRGGDIYMACRSGIPEAGDKIKSSTKAKTVEMLHVDLSSVDSIHSYIVNLRTKGIKIDIVVFNAGIVPKKATPSSDGLELMFAVNYFAKYVQLKKMIEHDLLAPNARIIFISSESHRTGRAIDFNHFGEFEEFGIGKVIAKYGDSKLLLSTFAQELHRRVGDKYQIHTLCPGPVNSNIAKAAPGWSQPLLKGVFTLFFSSPEKAAEPANYLACAKEMEGKTNYYLHLMSKKDPDTLALDPEVGKKLWEATEQLYQEIISR